MAGNQGLSQEERSRLVEQQLRDKNGRWISMGKKASFFSKSKGGMQTGTIVGNDGLFAYLIPPLENPTHRPMPYKVPLSALGMVPDARATIDSRSGDTRAAERNYTNEQRARFDKSFTPGQKKRADNYAAAQRKAQEENLDVDTLRYEDGKAPALTKAENPDRREANQTTGTNTAMEEFHAALEDVLRQRPAPSSSRPTASTFESNNGLSTRVVNHQDRSEVTVKDRNGNTIETYNIPYTGGDTSQSAKELSDDLQRTIYPRTTAARLNLDLDQDGIPDHLDDSISVSESGAQTVRPGENIHNARRGTTLLQGETAYVKTDRVAEDGSQDGLWSVYTRNADTDAYEMQMDSEGYPNLVPAANLIKAGPNGQSPTYKHVQQSRPQNAPTQKTQGRPTREQVGQYIQTTAAKLDDIASNWEQGASLAHPSPAGGKYGFNGEKWYNLLNPTSQMSSEELANFFTQIDPASGRPRFVLNYIPSKNRPARLIEAEERVANDNSRTLEERAGLVSAPSTDNNPTTPTEVTKETDAEGNVLDTTDAPESIEVPEARELRALSDVTNFEDEDLIDEAFKPNMGYKAKRRILREMERRGLDLEMEMFFFETEDGHENISMFKNGRKVQIGDVVIYRAGWELDEERREQDGLLRAARDSKGDIPALHQMVVVGFKDNKPALVPLRDHGSWSRISRTSADEDNVRYKDMSLSSALGKADALGYVVVQNKITDLDDKQGVDYEQATSEGRRVTTNRAQTPILADGTEVGPDDIIQVRGQNIEVRVDDLDEDGNVIGSHVERGWGNTTEATIAGIIPSSQSLKIAYTVTDDDGNELTRLGTVSMRYATAQGGVEPPVKGEIIPDDQVKDRDKYDRDAAGRLMLKREASKTRQATERAEDATDAIEDDSQQFDRPENQEQIVDEAPQETNETLRRAQDAFGDVDDEDLPEIEVEAEEAATDATEEEDTPSETETPEDVPSATEPESDRPEASPRREVEIELEEGTYYPSSMEELNQNVKDASMNLVEDLTYFENDPSDATFDKATESQRIANEVSNASTINIPEDDETPFDEEADRDLNNAIGRADTILSEFERSEDPAQPVAEPGEGQDALFDVPEDSTEDAPDTEAPVDIDTDADTPAESPERAERPARARRQRTPREPYVATREEEEQNIEEATRPTRRHGVYTNDYMPAEPYSTSISRFGSNFKKRTFRNDREKMKFLMDNAPVGTRIAFPESGGYAIRMSPDTWQVKEGFGKRFWKSTNDRRVRNMITQNGGFGSEDFTLKSPTKAEYEFNFGESMRINPQLRTAPVGSVVAEAGGDSYTKTAPEEWTPEGGSAIPEAELEETITDANYRSVPIDRLIESVTPEGVDPSTISILGDSYSALRPDSGSGDYILTEKYYDARGKAMDVSIAESKTSAWASDWVSTQGTSYDDLKGRVAFPDKVHTDDERNTLSGVENITAESALASTDVAFGTRFRAEGIDVAEGVAVEAWKNPSGGWSVSTINRVDVDEDFRDVMNDGEPFFHITTDHNFPEAETLSDAIMSLPEATLDDLELDPDELIENLDLENASVSQPTKRVEMGNIETHYPEVPTDRSYSDEELEQLIETTHEGNGLNFSGASFNEMAGALHEVSGYSPIISRVDSVGRHTASIEGDTLSGFRQSMEAIVGIHKKHPWIQELASITASSKDSSDSGAVVGLAENRVTGNNYRMALQLNKPATISGAGAAMLESNGPNTFSKASDPDKYIAMHEMGHVMDGSRMGLSSKESYEQFILWLSELLGVSPESVKGMTYAQLSGILTKDYGMSKYGVVARDLKKVRSGDISNLNFHETYAESIADVEQNGVNASEGSKFFYKKLVKDGHDRMRYIQANGRPPKSVKELEDFLNREGNDSE